MSFCESTARQEAGSSDNIPASGFTVYIWTWSETVITQPLSWRLVTENMLCQEKAEIVSGQESTLEHTRATLHSEGMCKPTPNLNTSLPFVSECIQKFIHKCVITLIKYSDTVSMRNSIFFRLLCLTRKVTSSGVPLINSEGDHFRHRHRRLSWFRFFILFHTYWGKFIILS
jgi:hypothetical protein